MFDGKFGMNGVHRCIETAIELNVAFLARPERDAVAVKWLCPSLEVAREMTQHYPHDALNPFGQQAVR